MPVCAGIKRTGGRCTVSVGAGQTYCHHHDPARAEERSRAASRAARSKPSREIAAVKGEIRDLIADILSGELERGRGAVALQAYNVLARYLELERRRDEDALEERLENLERAVMELAEARARWGA
jgi:hypothetical protein